MRKKKKGMTLLEIVIALAIIGIMMLPLANSLLTSVKANKKGEDVQSSKLLAQQIVESLRVQGAIKNGSLNMAGGEFDINEIAPATNNEFTIKSKNPVKGYDVDGHIKGHDIINFNSSPYLDTTNAKNKLGALLIVEDQKITLIKGNSSSFDIDKLRTDTSLTKWEMPTSTNKNIEINISDTNVEILNSNGSKIELGEKLENVLGVYVKETNNTKFNIKNISTKKQTVYVFRDSSLSQEEGKLKPFDGSTEISTGDIYAVHNIIYDSEGRKKGLYDVKLDIKKDNKIVEKIESQFYLGK